MGQERASTIMNLLPPTGWGDVATRRDLHVLENHIDALEVKLNARIETLDSNLNARIETLDSNLNARIDTLEARFDAKLESRLGELRSDLMRTLGTWLFASQAAVIAVVTLLVTLT
jgi:BMFP domain-containing protein YqiC